MGSACMKGPSFWCSASNSDRYWLQKQEPPFAFVNQEHTNSSKANQTDRAKSKGCSTESPRLCLFPVLISKTSQEKKKKPTHLSTSGLLLIWGEAALAGEKLGLYKPDMAHFFLVFLKDWKKKTTSPQKKVEKEGLVGVVLAEEKGDTEHHQLRGVCNKEKNEKGWTVLSEFYTKGSNK